MSLYYVLRPYAAIFCPALTCCLMQVFFNPEIYNSDFTTPLPAVIDKCIQTAPIDTRRALYKVSDFIFSGERVLSLNTEFIL